MAATAYAFLVSLVNTMDQIQIHPVVSSFFEKSRFETLREKVVFLLDFVENQSDAVIGEKGDFLLNGDCTEAEDLLSRIAVVAQLGEDIIEVEAANRIRELYAEESQVFLQDMQEIMEEMDSIKEEVMKVKEERRFQDEQSPPTSSMASPPPPSSALPPATTKTTMVGFDGYLNKLLDELNGYHSSRRILPIVGMGGVGKTTLARNVYDNLLIVEHFAIRVWVTVSQTFDVSDIFLQALSCLGESSSGTTDDDELGKKLRKCLYGRRYLIILDDMWSIEAWEKIKFYFPDNNNGSRIVVTTRQQELVDYFASSAVAVDFLDEETSWELLCDKAFGQEGCPSELEEAGKKIAKKCKGLPLAISVLGGLLRKSPRTQEYWENMARDKSLIPQEDSGEGNKLLSLLYMSYKHLPVFLKSCFLYLGLFPEDHQIDVSQLIKLFVAEGFIKVNRNQILEEVSESHIKELVDRNLLIVGDLSLTKKFKTCHVHDLVRELCIRIAEKENFYCVQRNVDGTRHFIVDARTATFYPQQSRSSSPSLPSLYQPLIFDGERESPFKSRLLRVMVRPVKRTCQDVNLRLLCDCGRHSIAMNHFPPNLPSSLSPFWSLQTLFFPEAIFHLPPEIWKMPQLRHIELYSVRFPDPPPHDAVVVLQNLQTLRRVFNIAFTEDVCKRMPNIKELYIIYNDETGGHLQNLSRLEKLESLRFSSTGKEHVSRSLLKWSSSLKELSLGACRLPWSDLAIIGLLPRLQVLHLRKGAVVGEAWNLGTEERFRSLKYLEIERCDDFVCWDADSSNFPVLETLILWHSELEEIPSGIGEIPTLERIEMTDCCESANVSAVKILEEQESIENLDLRVRLRFFQTEDAEMWKEKVRELGITCQNRHISNTR